MKIRDVMTTEVQTVGPDQTVKEAASFMLNNDTGSIPVRDGGQLIGMITDRDIAVRGVAEGLGPETAVRDLMSEDVVCAREDDEVTTVARRMSEAQVRRLPVLNADGNLVGIVSLGDLSREASDVAASRALEGVSAPGGQHQQ
jgi:CBS domain-containing protein